MFARDKACGGRCLVLEAEISGYLVRCPEHAAAGRGLVTRAGMVSAPSAQSHRLGQMRVGVEGPANEVSSVSSQ